MDDIPGSAPVQDHRHSATRETFEDYASAALANGWKYHDICGSQALEHFLMLNQPQKETAFLIPRDFDQLLEFAPLRAIADKREMSQTLSQKRSSGAQTNVDSFSANEAAHENQLKFGAGLRPARVNDTQRTSDAILRDKKRLVAVCRQTRSGYGTPRR